MYALLERPVVRGTLACLVVVSLLLVPMHQPAQGKPVIQVIIVAIGFGLIGVGVACLTQWLDICKDGGGKKGGGGGGNNDDDNGDGGGGGENNDDDNGDGDGNGNNVPIQCGLSNINGCGMQEPRTTFPGVACDLSPIPNSQCPVPVIGEADFYADPDRVRSGNTTRLYWEVSNATVCSLTGGGLNLLSLLDEGAQETNDITAATTFTLTCSNGSAVDSPKASQQTNVTLIPSFQEI
ncbi:hypothetical protein A3F55_00270 [Candidatus Adlerbacteria bacterium RIFCSPHIGHO2_12_FULL_53_18]|uniref:Uncharacterized protein n=1 Tax=Candidatus Adlerbacteria bacterium RIFCSPHIGHO2_12_FULL_53_18 TaxID=1797242 RepID=A0A1F4XRS8_9BACT|nr:MAG: hypothetical protein A3F55_00270 [Candidatus Adlerbacteria bacterium RIFCSPHIGHO2_12_FULL_53_18]